MQADVLTQLRDIHTPAPPSWWPPAPGWWFAAAMVLLAVAFVTRLVLRRWQRRRPIRESQQLLAKLYQDYQQGATDPVSFVNASNELLKRLLVHTLSRDDARPASGEAWLNMLDDYSASNDFTHGPGRVLGHSRFQPAPTIDVPALHALLSQFLQRVGP